MLLVLSCCCHQIATRFQCDYCPFNDFKLLYMFVCGIQPNGSSRYVLSIKSIEFKSVFFWFVDTFRCFCCTRDYRLWLATDGLAVFSFKHDSHFVLIVDRHHQHAFSVDYDPFALVSFRFECDRCGTNVFPLWWRTVMKPIQEHHHYQCQPNTWK